MQIGKYCLNFGGFRFSKDHFGGKEIAARLLGSPRAGTVQSFGGGWGFDADFPLRPWPQLGRSVRRLANPHGSAVYLDGWLFSFCGFFVSRYTCWTNLEE